MQAKRNGNDQLRVLAIAFGGAIVAAVATMFLPIGALETVTGSTGISEIFPATAAPLGDTARALIAFVVGVLTLAALAYPLLRRKARPTVKAETARVGQPAAVVPVAPVVVESAAPATTPVTPNQTTGVSLLQKIRNKLESLTHRGDDDGVTDLADLPKLRSSDAHPDAPPRRPISANRDFGPAVGPYIPEIELPGATAFVPVAAPIEPVVVPDVAEPEVVEVVDVIETEIAEPAAMAEPAHIEALDLMPDASPAVGDAIEPVPTATDAPLHDMVASLEAAVAQRQSQLDRLEDIAKRMTTTTTTTTTPAGAALPQANTANSPKIAFGALQDAFASDQPARHLEAVAPVPPRPRNGDEALRSALATLHRMNARSS